MEPAVEMRPGMARTAIRRRWRIIAAAAMIGLAGGVAATALSTPSYSATAVVYLNPLDGNPYSPDTPAGRSDQLTALETEATLLTTSAAGERANAVASDALPADPETRVSVEIPSNSQVLRVTYRGDEPDEANLGAQSFAVAHLMHRQEQAELTAERQLGRLEAQLESTEDLLEQATKELADAAAAAAELGVPANTAGIVLLQQQVQTYASQLAQLHIEVTAMAGTHLDAGEVINPATVPTDPDGPPGPAMIVAGLVAGLALGLVGALWREHADTRLHDGSDVEALGTGPVLAVLPYPTPLGSPPRSARPAVASFFRDSAEAFRVLRTATLTSVPARPAVITVLGVSRDVDGTGVAAGLAHAIERSGRRAALLLVNPSSDAMRMSGTGVSDLLRQPSGDVSAEAVDDASQSTSSSLVVIGPGRSTGSAEDLVSSAAVGSLLDRVREQATIVVIAAPAAGTAAGQELAAAADASILVAQLERNTHDELLAAYDALRHRQATVAGVAVATRPPKLKGFHAPDVWGVLGVRAAAPMPKGEVGSTPPGVAGSTPTATDDLVPVERG